LKKTFLEYCTKNKFQQNTNQIKVLDSLIIFNKQTNFFINIFSKLFNRRNTKLGFYLYGDVGIGKTMLLNYFFKNLNIPKLRMHFNEFMINFHDFRHENNLKRESNSIEIFVKNIKKKADLIYLDEFQVTNIVDAMILGKLFESIFKENIKIIISSNTKIEDLYKDGLQRDQFLPFIKIIKNFCIEHHLVIEQDYRRTGQSKLERFFHPLNEKTTFQINQSFRHLSRGKKNSIIKLNIKERSFKINSFFEGVARFDFKDLCDVNIGAEDYIAIFEKCNFITIDNIPNFNDETSNQQQRFITLIDILYEKKIPLMVSSDFNLENFTSSRRLTEPYKRTISRLFELTSPTYNKST
jgi:cell division protein ZapE